jgi:hypothetical protein
MSQLAIMLPIFRTPFPKQNRDVYDKSTRVLGSNLLRCVSEGFRIFFSRHAVSVYPTGSPV